MKAIEQNKLSGLKQGLDKVFLLVLVILITQFQLSAQECSEIEIKKKMSIEFEYGHECMTQTRAATKEEAFYGSNHYGAVKYELSKKGKRFTIFEQNNGKWFKWGEYEVRCSFIGESQGVESYNFLTSDASAITYIPNTPSGMLMIIDIVGEEFVYFVSE